MKAPRAMAFMLARALGEVKGVGQHDLDKGLLQAMGQTAANVLFLPVFSS